jgi:hypothetical protein
VQRKIQALVVISLILGFALGVIMLTLILVVTR